MDPGVLSSRRAAIAEIAGDVDGGSDRQTGIRIHSASQLAVYRAADQSMLIGVVALVHTVRTRNYYSWDTF